MQRSRFSEKKEQICVFLPLFAFFLHRLFLDVFSGIPFNRAFFKGVLGAQAQVWPKLAKCRPFGGGATVGGGVGGAKAPKEKKGKE